MRFIFTLFLLLPFAFASDVLEFNDSNFENRVKEHSIILVEFFAPWCGHCKKLAPEYENAATTLKKQDPPISIAKVDCTVETKTCEKYGVRGYPTLKIFKNGQFSSEYNGERSGDGIVKYMISKSGPPSKELLTEESLLKFTTSTDSVIVGFFDKTSSDLYKAFQNVAEKLNEDFRFAHVVESSVLSKLNFNNDIVIYRPHKMANKFEDSVVKYKGDESEFKIRSWIEKNVMGIAGVRQSTNIKYFNEKPLVVAFYKVDYENNAKSTNYWRNRVMKVAKKFLDAGKSLYFAISDVHQFGHELNEFGVESTDKNKVYVIARDDKNQKFKMEKDFSLETFENFLNDFVSNKLQPYLKSEDVPEKNDDPVKVVVAKNFDSIVNDASKDVLIEFYAPWCGHCKSLAPKYEELAEKLRGESDVVIAKMDATANDVPSNFEVRGFPTIYFVPKNSKQSPKQYNGGREVEDMIKYIASEASSPLKTYDLQGRPIKSDL